MMNNFDQFLRYFDKRMNLDEKLNFEKKLEVDANFKEGYEKFVLQNSFSKNPINVEDKYFEELIVRTRNRIDYRKNRFSPNYRIAFALPLLVIGAFFLYHITISNNNSKYNFNEIYNSYIKNDSLAMDLVKEAVATDGFYFYENVYSQEIFNADIIPDASIFDYVEENFTLSEINYNFLNELSEDEFNNVYYELINRL